MPNKGKFIGSQDNLFVPDAPTIGATSGATDGEVSVAFTAPSDVGNDAITLYGASVFLAGATINYKVSVGTGTLSTGGSGNVYFIDGIPTKTLSLIKGFTYVFDMSDSSNSGHPFGFKDSGGSSYTTGVTTSGTAGNASATVTLVLATDASEPSRYYCTSHGNGMGNTISLIEASASTDPLGAAQAGATGSSSPVTVTGLTNGTSYIAQVWAINDYGNGPLSSASNSFSPVVPTVGLIKGGYAASAPTDTVNKIIPETAGNATDFGNLSASNYSLGALSSDTRSVAAGGYYNNSAYTNTIEYFTFASAGNATDFGDASAVIFNTTGISNNVRGVFALGNAGGSNVNTLEYITIPSTGNSIDFGDATEAKDAAASVGSSTRGVFAGRATSYTNVIEYITIASSSNATDFGDLTTSRGYMHGGASSSTRGVFGPGLGNGGSTYYNTLDYITIASTGNATDFGDALAATYGTSGMSNSTRGIFSGGQDSGGRLNVIQQITIATTGNATDFGDLLSVTSYNASTCSGNPAVQNETGFAPAAIGLFAGGEPSAGGNQSTIEYIDIATTGNSSMFGDLTGKRYIGGLGSGIASATRGVFAGGHTGSGAVDIIEYVTFSTKSKATDFGNLTSTMYAMGAASNSTRGIAFGGHSGSATTNVIQYVTIASAGNATDFGDLGGTSEEGMALANTTRGVHHRATSSNVMEYVTIASTGNATDFGDTITNLQRAGAVASSTRGVFAGGKSDFYTTLNVIQYITIASEGNSTDFGDLGATIERLSGVSSGTRGVFSSSNAVTGMEYITIASTGNATDFGDMSLNAGHRMTASSAHGGIA